MPAPDLTLPDAAALRALCAADEAWHAELCAIALEYTAAQQLPPFSTRLLRSDADLTERVVAWWHDLDPAARERCRTHGHVPPETAGTPAQMLAHYREWHRICRILTAAVPHLHPDRPHHVVTWFTDTEAVAEAVASEPATPGFARSIRENLTCTIPIDWVRAYLATGTP